MDAVSKCYISLMLAMAAFSSPSSSPAATSSEPAKIAFRLCATRAEREALAREMLKAFQMWDSAVPYLRPEENEWAQKEGKRLTVLKASDMEAWVPQMSKFSKTKEFAVIEGRGLLDPPIKSLSDLLERKYLESSTGENLPDLEDFEIKAWSEFQEVCFITSRVSRRIFALLRENVEAVPVFEIDIGIYSSHEDGTPFDAVGKAVSSFVLAPYLQKLADSKANRASGEPPADGKKPSG
jgi:hypothetical protein